MRLCGCAQLEGELRGPKKQKMAAPAPAPVMNVNALALPAPAPVASGSNAKAEAKTKKTRAKSLFDAYVQLSVISESTHRPTRQNQESSESREVSADHAHHPRRGPLLAGRLRACVWYQRRAGPADGDQ